MSKRKVQKSIDVTKLAPPRLLSRVQGEVDVERSIRRLLLGRRLREVYVASLWRERYQSFPAFCRSWGISAHSAYVLMDVASDFSQEDVLRFGWAKLMHVLRAPEEYRPPLLRMLHEGASKRVVAGVVTELRRRLKLGKRLTGRKVTPLGCSAMRRVA